MVLFFPKFPRGAFPQTPWRVWAWIRSSLFRQIVSYTVAQYYITFVLRIFLIAVCNLIVSLYCQILTGRNMTERKKQTNIFWKGFIWHILSITQISQVYLKQRFLSTNHSFAKSPLQRLLIPPLPMGNSILYLIKYSFINLNYHFFHYCTFFLCNSFSLSFSFHWGTFLWCFFSVGHFKDFILKLLPDDLLLILVCCYWARSSSRKKQGLLLFCLCAVSIVASLKFAKVMGRPTIVASASALSI